MYMYMYCVHVLTVFLYPNPVLYIQKDASARTLSDPALRLTEALSRDNLSDEERKETTTRLLEEIVALKLVISNEAHVLCSTK